MLDNLLAVLEYVRTLASISSVRILDKLLGSPQKDTDAVSMGYDEQFPFVVDRSLYPSLVKTLGTLVESCLGKNIFFIWLDHRSGL